MSVGGDAHKEHDRGPKYQNLRRCIERWADARDKANEENKRDKVEKGTELLVLEASAKVKLEALTVLPDYLNFCPNDLRVPKAVMEEPVLQAIEEHVLVPERVEEFIQVTERDDVREKQAEVDRERQDIERRLRALTSALERGGQLDTLVERIAKLEAHLKGLPRLVPVPRLQPKVIEDRLAEWRRLLRQSPTQARAVDSEGDRRSPRLHARWPGRLHIRGRDAFRSAVCRDRYTEAALPEALRR